MDNMMRYLNPNKLKLISKGVDSVRSRVINLKEKYPNLTRDIIYDSIEREFLTFHGINPDDKTQYDKSEIEDETKNENPKIRELFNYYNSWDWKFGECPEFTNSLQHKFNWGLVDLCLRAEKGIIKESTIFSDCLNTDFIEKINQHLRNLEGKFNYNKEGLVKLFDTILEMDPEMKNNLEFKNYIDDMKSILVNYI
jgi:lipoate---protein ligase